MNALNVLCAQLTRDLFAIAKFLLSNLANRQTDKRTRANALTSFVGGKLL